MTELLKHERIRTTLAKAREVRPIAEQMVTLGKAGSLHDRRRAAAFINERQIVGKVFEDLADRYSERNGGYTRITKLGPRKGTPRRWPSSSSSRGGANTSRDEGCGSD